MIARRESLKGGYRAAASWLKRPWRALTGRGGLGLLIEQVVNARRGG